MYPLPRSFMHSIISSDDTGDKMRGLKYSKYPLLVLLIAPLFTFLILASEARGDFYHYTDSNGVLHLTNVPTSSRYRWLMPESSSAQRVYASYDEIISNVSKAHGVSTELVRAIIKAESDFNPRAKSWKGAMGIMQLMPETARLWGVRDIYDPRDNIEGGVKHLRYLLDTFNHDIALAAAAYNAGENAVIKYGDIPPFEETRTFVERVLSYHRRYRDARR